jgi:hypothetical protein
LTVNFATAKCTSDYLEFVRCERPDRNFAPLQDLDGRDYEIIDTFNPNQIFHFLVVGGHFMEVNSDYALKTSGSYG